MAENHKNEDKYFYDYIFKLCYLYYVSKVSKVKRNVSKVQEKEIFYTLNKSNNIYIIAD